MGWIRHEAVIIQGSDEFDKKAKHWVREFKAICDENEEYCPHFIAGPMCVGNGYTFWFLAPDGSKEGWPTSDRCGEFREQFMELAAKHHCAYIHLRLWGDEGEYDVLNFKEERRDA